MKILKSTVLFALIYSFAFPAFAQESPPADTESTAAAESTANAETTAPAESIRQIIGGYTISSTTPNLIKPSWILAEIKPGESFESSVTVANNSNEQLNFKVYSADETTTQTGSFTIKTRSVEKEFFGLWADIEEELTLAPGESKDIPFTISIPVDTPLGVYKGGIAAQSDGVKTSANIVSSTRVVVAAEVTVTADPQEIPLATKTTKYIFTPTPYFYASIAIFLLCIGYFLYARKKNK